MTLNEAVRTFYGAGAHARDWCWVYTLKRAEP